MAQVTETVARGILAGQGYTDNEVRQLAHHWLASHGQAPAQAAPQHQARPVTPYTCPKCSALWLHWPAEQSGFGRDTLNCRSTTHCDYCEKGGVEQLQRLERVPAVLAAAPTTQPDLQLPERDASVPAEQQGLFRKFDVRRVDGSDQPGGKHHGCRYFVLDVDHDQHAHDALTAYAAACESSHPELAADLRTKWGAASPTTPPAPAAQSFESDGWLHENGLLYRLTDERYPTNRDEINVTMADGSRSIESRSRRALELLNRIRGAEQ